jgi:alkylresorcinol/alkylpyrone synthase
MPRISRVKTGVPPHYYDQETLIGVLVEYWAKRYHNPQRIIDFQRNVLVGGRHLAMPVERYKKLNGFGEHNDAWIEAAVPLATRVLGELLDEAGMEPADISLIASTTVTGLAVPSLEARVMNQLAFSRDTKRVPLFGWGCMGGAAGLNLVADYLVGHPTEAALLLSVELCSLTIQRSDLSIANIVASGLFGDGCSAVLLVGDEHPLAESAPLSWLSSRSVTYPDTERVLGWDVVDTGFSIVLAPSLAGIVSEHLPGEVEKLLSSADITDERPVFYAVHPGGPKVLEAASDCLDLAPGTLQASWDVLSEYGNLSSSAVLFVLERTIAALPEAGSLGILFAFGPGFSCELTLLRAQ